MSDVEHFMIRFRCNNTVNDVFTSGACYWFARTLYERFKKESPTIMYSQEDNHFGTRIGDDIYDITGNVTSKYNWIRWCDFDDCLERKRIVRDCIMF